MRSTVTKRASLSVTIIGMLGLVAIPALAQDAESGAF